MTITVVFVTVVGFVVGNEDRFSGFACFSVINTRPIVDYFTGGGQEGGVQVLLISKLVAMFWIGNYKWCRCSSTSTFIKLIKSLRHHVFGVF